MGDFWYSFYDSDFAQRADIDSLRGQERALAHDVSAHTQRIQTLEKQVEELSKIVGAFMRVTSEMSQLDPRAVKLRVEAEIEAMEAARQKFIAEHRHSKQVPKAPVPDVPVQCAKCGQTVPSSRTTITETGTLCDKCAR